jgi:hypothetical protein
VSRVRQPGRGVRVLVAAVLLVAMGGLFAALSAQLIAVHRADAQRMGGEREALPYVDAIGRLVTDLVEARSSAVRGQAEAPANLRVSMGAVADLQARFGAELLTEQRWTALQAAIDSVLTQRPTGADASDRYADLIGMTNGLLSAALAASQLDADPEQAGRSLVVAVRELAALVVATGQAADVSVFAAAAADPDAATEERIDLAVALHDAASAYGGLSGALTSAVAAGSWPPFTSAVTEQLNLLHDALLPSVGQAVLRPPTSADAATLDAVARQVRELVRSTTPAVLDELGRQLTSREEAARNRMLLGIGTAAAGFVLGIVVLWWSAAPPAPAPEGSDEALVSGPDVASVSVNLPAVDARELLALEELVHVGRGVRGRPPGGADNAE